jgi:hypothetical protein
MEGGRRIYACLFTLTFHGINYWILRKSNFQPNQIGIVNDLKIETIPIMLHLKDNRLKLTILLTIF